MNVYYTIDNIALFYWGWCTKRQLNSKNIFCKHNNTDAKYSFSFKDDCEAMEFYKLLENGVEKEKVVKLLASISNNPIGVFEFLLEQEIIE